MKGGRGRGGGRRKEEGGRRKEEGGRRKEGRKEERKERKVKINKYKLAQPVLTGTTVLEVANAIYFLMQPVVDVVDVIYATRLTFK